MPSRTFPPISVCTLLLSFFVLTIPVKVLARMPAPISFLDLPPLPIDISYHNGTLLSSFELRQLYLLWYGNFTATQTSIISDFLSSLLLDEPDDRPSVSKWWKVTRKFFQKAGHDGRCMLHLNGQAVDSSAQLGKNLKRADVGRALKKAIHEKKLPLDSDAVYLVLTADDIQVERFCMNSCGYHEQFAFSPTDNLMYAWVGNPGTHCPTCAWPFAVPEFGPKNFPALVSPNGDVGADGMIINIATLLAGLATNPLNNGFYQGDPGLPMEAVSACSGTFGAGAYPGYPGKLLIDESTGASYNALGLNDRKFLIPSIFNPATLSCFVVS